MIKNRITLFVATLLVVGFFFLAMPENGYTGGANPLGCCITGAGCTGCGSLEICAIRDNNCDGTGFATGQVCIGQTQCDFPADIGGCCVLTEEPCIDGETFVECASSVESIAWFENESCSDVPQCQQAVVSAVPTLSQWGLIATAGILGFIGFMIIRRRKATA